MSFSEFTQQDYELIARDYTDLKETAKKRCANERELEIVEKAFNFANEAHKNVRRRSGEPYIIHPIAVAKIVVSTIGLGYKSISAALLHDVVEDTDYTSEDIRNLFGEKIAVLVEGLTKIKTVLDNEDKNKRSNVFEQSEQAENFKRILLTLNDDVRVVLIKLADRLHNCRTIEFMPEYKRDKILSETMYIFIPLAHRLGLYEVKSEMENIWLQYKEPDTFRIISKEVEKNVSEQGNDIDNFVSNMKNALNGAGFNFEIRKRIKTPYSIWHKMQTKNITFDQVYDLYAVRIVFTPDPHSTESERDQCYHIFSIITGIYRYKPDRVRDWVKHPKSNGYEALHCTLMTGTGLWIEVQIRTKRMDDIAEKGIAAHWAYKKDGYISENDSEMDKWLIKVKEILVSPDVNALELLDLIHNDLTTSEIMVFTPKGEQKSICKGATALDFAYSIHTEIGNKAIAAKVNMKLVPLSHVLRTGDQVEIITAEEEKPKPEWLTFLKSRKAINLVSDYLKSRNKLSEKIDEKSKDKEEISIIDENAQERKKYIIASCCHPIPGDSVVGFKNADGTITIHKKTCHVAENLASIHGDRVVVPQWEKSAESRSFPVRISIKGIDRMGLMNDITKQLSLVMTLNITKVSLWSESGLFEGFIEVLVHDKSNLQETIEKLYSVDGIKSVIRTEILKNE